MPVFFKQMQTASGQTESNVFLLIFHFQGFSQHWSYSSTLREVDASQEAQSACVIWSKVPHTMLSPITRGKFLINTPLTGTVTHRKLAFHSLLAAQPLSQSIGFKGTITLEYLLTTKRGGAGLYNMRTVKSNVSLVQKPYTLRLAWEQQK